MSPEEQCVLAMLSQAWNMFLLLPQEHGDDTDDFRRCLHDLQRIVLSRPARRQLNQDQFDATKWHGWTEHGEAWLAAGCPLIKQEPAT